MGSSPRVRGSLVAISKRHAAAGIIPAGAGLTYRPSCYYARNRDHPAGAGLTRHEHDRAYCDRDHPRGCGAHTALEWHVLFRAGSSPRVRGSLSNMIMNRKNQGIIPAGAGLTIRPSVLSGAAKDHPRGCGAHRDERGIINYGKGSSPRVRGSPAMCMVA